MYIYKVHKNQPNDVRVELIRNVLENNVSFINECRTKRTVTYIA